MGVRAISDPQKQGFHTSASDGIQVGQSDKEVGKLLLIRFSLAWLASVAACGRRAVRATATGPSRYVVWRRDHAGQLEEVAGSG